MSQLSDAYGSFSVYEAMKESRAPNLLGDERAKENAKIENGYKNFFVTIEWATFVHAILTLAKFFDNDKRGQALSIYRVIEFIELNRSSLSVENFKDYYKGRYALDELQKNYLGVTNEQLAEIKKEIQNSGAIIEKIRTLRDQYFAHNDIKREEVAINLGEITNLFKVVENIMQKICAGIMRESWSFEPLRDDSKNDTLSAIDHLRRFKPYHFKELAALRLASQTSLKTNRQ